MTVFILFKFEEDVEFTVANIMFNEFEDAKKHVNNSPGMTSYTLDKVPDIFTSKFGLKELPFGPEASKQYLVLNVTLFKAHLEKFERTSEYLANLRQYVHYHIHSAKTYLHSRIRSKVNTTHRQINLVKYESDDIKVYRSRKGEGVEVNFKPKNQEASDIILRAK